MGGYTAAMVAFFKQLFSHSQGYGTRANITGQIGWVLATLGGTIVVGAQCHAPEWVEILVGLCLVATVLFFFGWYSYFALHNPEALRTENYALTKIAIEKKLVGDNLQGLKLEEDGDELPLPPVGLIEGGE